MAVVVVSGGFDPLHKGHLCYLREARELITLDGCNGELIAIVNKNDFLIKKKGYFCLDEKTRLDIMSSIKYVDEAMLAVDNDMTVNETLKVIREKYRDSNIVFCNGGDRTEGNIPEAETCKKLDILMYNGLGDKIESSSNIINNVIKQLKSKEEKRNEIQDS